MSLDKVWNFSVRFMNIIGNVAILQVINIILLLTGYLAVVIPVIIIVNTLVIYDYIYDHEHFSITNIGSLLKNNFTSIVSYVVIAYILLSAVGINQSMQTVVIAQNVGFWTELMLLILSVIVGVSTITFMMFFPLVACTTEQDLIMKIKVTFIVPFFSLKAYFLIIVLTVINGMFFFSNALFLILFGPILLIAVNLIIFHVYVINKEEK